jgi:hypothetical protein
VAIIMAAGVFGAGGSFINHVWTTAMQQLIPEALNFRVRTAGELAALSD